MNQTSNQLGPALADQSCKAAYQLTRVSDHSTETRDLESAAGLECVVDVIRALWMGSCFSAENRNPLPGSPCSPSFNTTKKKSSRKRPGSHNSSFEHRREEPLHRIPGRMFLNGSSEVASLFTQRGKKGLNQDAMVVWENFGSRTDTIFCGVFDGHGPHGHMVAKRVRDLLPVKLSSHWEVNPPGTDVLNDISTSTESSLNSGNTMPISAEGETEKNPAIFKTLKESFLKAFRNMDRELQKHSNIECFVSGTTAVTLVKQGRHLIIGNVGDSRAILGRRNDVNTLVAEQLTVDLKPNLPAEAERIKKCRGRVFALDSEPDVARVWLPNMNSPGLAMARALGDFCLKDFGLISVPDVSYRHLTNKDDFIVLASDGIWDVLSNEEVVEIVASAPERSTAARALVEIAVRTWKYKYPTSKIDDCAAVCLFLDSDSNNLSKASISQPDKVELDTENTTLTGSSNHHSQDVQNEETQVSKSARNCSTLK